MASVVNSLADDDKAYNWDDPTTDMVDESMDGVCKDELGRCTLRAALLEADALGIAANVTFSVTGTISVDPNLGSFGIPPESVIDGGGRKVAIAGAGPFSFLFLVQDHTTIKGLEFIGGTDGIDVSGDFNIIGGLTPDDGNGIRGMTQNGILLIGKNNIVRGNYIGIMPDNSGTNGNQFGVFVIGGDNTIGGTIPGSRNIISGNSIAGIAISGDTSNGGGRSTVITGNFIGTDIYGTQATGNQYGVEILTGDSHIIGGTTPAERNIISGNTVAGVTIGIIANACAVRGNYIGTNVSGSDKVPNRDGVILAPGARDCLIEYNEIRYNSSHGILIAGGAGILESKGNYMYGNLISANDSAGIVIVGNANDNIIGSSLSTDYDANEIRYNGSSASLGTTAGVLIAETGQGAPQRNTIRKNDFYDNYNAGILFDLLGNVQKDIKPPAILTYADVGGGYAHVTGTHKIPGATIDFYTGEKVLSSNYEGRHWLGSGAVASDSTYSFDIEACNCSYIVATATDAAGSTSEFTYAPFGITGVAHSKDSRPSDFAIAEAYPNPFNPSTTIRYELPERAQVSLKIYDALGRELSTLFEGVQEAGYRSSTWNALKAPSGVYFCRIVATTLSGAVKSFTFTKKLVLAR